MELLFGLSSHPAVLMCAVVLASWIWEDAAVIAAALLAVDGQLSVPLALVAAFVGIVSGDLGLYYLGRLGHRWRGLRGWILIKPHGRLLSKRFRQRTLSNIMLVRFVPGLRTLGFALCGLWRVPLMRFVMAMGLAGVIWIAVVFTGIYQLGSTAFFENSHWKWSLMGAAFGILIFNNIWAFRRSRKGVAP